MIYLLLPSVGDAFTEQSLKSPGLHITSVKYESFVTVVKAGLGDAINGGLFD